MKKNLLLSFFSCCVLFISPTSKAQNQITFYTSMGDFVVEMYDTITPITSGNFIDLVKQKYYDGIIFHRVIDNFMIQGGDPTGTGSGGPGYSIQDEFDSRASNVQKTISMANSGPNTGGSQFFINLVDNTRLDYNKPPSSSKHAVFGFVTSNFEVVQAIGGVATNGSDRPLTDVVMDSLRITYSTFTGIESKTTASPLQLFPNPGNNQSTLLYHSAKNERITIRVFDPLGKQLLEKTTTVQSGSNRLKMEALLPLMLVPGLYTLQIAGDSHQEAVRFVFTP
jgi:peptidylprolyl isomerase